MKRVRSARGRSALAALVLCATVVAACGGNDPSASTQAPGDSTEATDPPVLTNAPTTTNPELVPVPGGTLTIGIDADASGYNPTVDPWGYGGHNIGRAIFDTLATYDASGKEKLDISMYPVLVPGAALFLTVLSLTLIGDTVQKRQARNSGAI